MQLAWRAKIILARIRLGRSANVNFRGSVSNSCRVGGATSLGLCTGVSGRENEDDLGRGRLTAASGLLFASVQRIGPKVGRRSFPGIGK